MDSSKLNSWLTSISNKLRASGRSRSWSWTWCSRTNLPNASTFVFIKTDGAWSDADALAFFDANDYVVDHESPRSVGWLGVYDDGTWLQVIDGWDYKIVDRPNMGQQFSEISRRFDVFFFWVGDADMAFNYGLYRQGEIVRSVWISSPKFTDRVVRWNEGKPLPGEERVFSPYDGDLLLENSDQYIPSLLAIAAGLGANVDYTESTFSIYWSPVD